MKLLVMSAVEVDVDHAFVCSCCGRTLCFCHSAETDDLCWDCWHTELELSESILLGQLGEDEA